MKNLKLSVRKKVDLKLQWIKNVLQKNGSILIVLNSPLVMVEKGRLLPPTSDHCATVFLLKKN